MKLRSVSALVALVTAGLMAAPAAYGGYRLTQEEGREILVSKGRLKQVPREGGSQSVFDLSTGRMWFSVPKKKVYWEGTVDEFCGQMHEMMSSMTGMMNKMMEEQMAKLPPEQRAQMEAMQKKLGGQGSPDTTSASRPAPKVAITRGDETTTIAGQQVRKYRVTLDGELHEEAWLTTDPAIAKEFMLDKAAAAMGRFSACTSEHGPGARGPRRTAETEIFEKLYPQGFPLKRTVYRNGKGEVEEEFTKVEAGNIPDSEFAPPQGYRRAATFTETMMGDAPAGMKRGKPPALPEESESDGD